MKPSVGLVPVTRTFSPFFLPKVNLTVGRLIDNWHFYKKQQTPCCQYVIVNEEQHPSMILFRNFLYMKTRPGWWLRWFTALQYEHAVIQTRREVERSNHLVNLRTFSNCFSIFWMFSNNFLKQTLQSTEKPLQLWT